MADQKIVCKNCNETFLFTERDQAFYKEKGFTPPQSCPACRAKRKAEKAGQDNRGGHGGFGNRPKRF